MDDVDRMKKSPEETVHIDTRDKLKIRMHTKYADDVDFMCQNDKTTENPGKTVEQCLVNIN